MVTELLPVDVVDLILSFLHSDIDALTTCAQSHLIFSKLSKPYIYANLTLCDDPSRIKTPTDLRTITLHLPHHILRTSKFAQILATKPDIANHVRSLTVACVKGRPGSKPDEATSSNLDGVASLLPMLVRLTAFTLMGSLTYNDYITWRSMPGTFRQAFLHLLHPQLVMKDIVINHIAFFPMSLLNNCRNIRITLSFCKDTQYHKESTNSEDGLPLSPVPFEHLSIQHCSGTCLRNIAPLVTMHGLRSLKYAHDSGESFPQFLVACSNSLKNLHLEINDIHTLTHFFFDNIAYTDGMLTRFPFTLASLRHLTQLTIDTDSSIYHLDETWSVHSPIPAIVKLISTAWPTLKKLSIDIMFTFAMSDFEQRFPDPVIVWSSFIPLAAKCSSASISMHIFPSFDFRISDSESNIQVSPDFSPLLADFKGLTPYVQNGVVMIL